MLASVMLRAAIAQYRGREGRERGVVLSGWRELDEYVLLGGLERGCVVGVSGDAEEGVGRMVSTVLVFECSWLWQVSFLWCCVPRGFLNRLSCFAFFASCRIERGAVLL